MKTVGGIPKVKAVNPFPPNVRKIGVPAPASMPEAKDIAAAGKLLASWGIEMVTGSKVRSGVAGSSYLSASDAARLSDLNSMLRDGSIDMILCARGGYGSMRILKGIDWATLKRRRLPLLGYSDITAIHLAMLAKGAGAPIVCNMASGLGKVAADPFSLSSMARVLKGGSPVKMKLKTLKRGEASGPLIPVNLTVMTALCGTPFMPSLKGAILAIEDIGEKPRAIDRMLAQLELSGILGQLSGLILCAFTECEGREDLPAVFKRYAASVDGPVMSGLPFGHCVPTLSFRMGGAAILERGSLLLR
jgi:muramoyltetrapeptide carboxypeptidase